MTSKRIVCVLHDATHCLLIYPSASNEWQTNQNAFALVYYLVLCVFYIREQCNWNLLLLYWSTKWHTPYVAILCECHRRRIADVTQHAHTNRANNRIHHCHCIPLPMHTQFAGPGAAHSRYRRQCIYNRKFCRHSFECQPEFGLFKMIWHGMARITYIYNTHTHTHRHIMQSSV